MFMFFNVVRSSSETTALEYQRLSAGTRYCDAHELFEALRQAHIFVRWFDSPRIRNYLRITIGTDAQMESLFAFLRKYLNK